jgi:hypothetical protein
MEGGGIIMVGDNIMRGNDFRHNEEVKVREAVIADLRTRVLELETLLRDCEHKLTDISQRIAFMQKHERKGE